MKKWYLPITLICVFSGFLISINLRAMNASETSPIAQDNTNLVRMIKNKEKENKNLIKEIEKNQKAYDELKKVVATTNNSIHELQLEIEHKKTIAGLTPVKGPGIILTLNDKTEEAVAAQDTDANPNDFLIHYEYILNIVNELRRAGAEAISVNNNRIVSISDIRCAGTLITVNADYLGPPYEIKAIGNKDKLYEAMKQGEYGKLEIFKFPVTLVKKDQIDIPAFKGNFDFNFSKVKGAKN